MYNACLEGRQHYEVRPTLLHHCYYGYSGSIPVISELFIFYSTFIKDWKLYKKKLSAYKYHFLFIT